MARETGSVRDLPALSSSRTRLAELLYAKGQLSYWPFKSSPGGGGSGKTDSGFDQ